MADDLDAFFSEIAEAETAVAANKTDEGNEVAQQDVGNVSAVAAPAIVAAAAPSQPAFKRARLGDGNDDALKSEEQILREELALLKPVVLANATASSSSLSAAATESSDATAAVSSEPSIYGPTIGPTPNFDNILSTSSVVNSNSKPNPYQPTEASYGAAGSSSSSSSSSSSTSASGLAGGLASSTTTTVTIKRSDKKFVRSGAGVVYVDNTLQEWPDNDYRLFVGDLGKETTDAMLTREFSEYKSFAKARVVRDKSGRTKGTFLLCWIK